MGFWTDRPVLVTGGAGFIGSHLVDSLLREGARVRVLARYSSAAAWGHLAGYQAAPPSNLDVRLGSVTDPGFTRAVTRDIDTVFHLAALIGIPYSYVAPAHYVETNVAGTLNVLEAARACAVRRVVHTSTSECFGTAQYVPMDEDHPTVAQSPYAATKIAADQLATAYARSFGTPVVTLRPFNTFGPRQSLRAVIPTIVAQLLAGPDVRIGSLTPVRDMNPVMNTVAAFLLAGSAPDVEGDVFVVGSGEGRTVGEILEMAAREIGVTPRVHVESERIRPAASEVEALVANYAKATARLGYKPEVSFEDGLRETITWIRSHMSESRNYAV